MSKNILFGVSHALPKRNDESMTVSSEKPTQSEGGEGEGDGGESDFQEWRKFQAMQKADALGLLSTTTDKSFSSSDVAEFQEWKRFQALKKEAGGANRRLTSETYHGGGQIVLYDFDQAQMDGYPTKLGDRPPLGTVLRDIGKSASIGYDEVSNKPLILCLLNLIVTLLCGA